MPGIRLSYRTFMSAAESLARAAASHIADGLQFAPKEEADRRLRVCMDCDQRKMDRCGKCGCNLLNKARIKYPQCPKWVPPTT